MTTFDKNGRLTSCYRTPTDPAVWLVHHAFVVMQELFRLSGLGHGTYRHMGGPGGYSKEELKDLWMYAKEHGRPSEELLSGYVWTRWAGHYGYHLDGRKWSKEDYDPASPAFQIYKEQNPKWHAFVEGLGPVPGLDER